MGATRRCTGWPAVERGYHPPVNIDIVRPFVQRTIASYLRIDEDALQVLEDGTIPIRAGESVVNVRLIDPDPGRPLLQVYSPVLHGVTSSPALLDKLNEINAHLFQLRAFFDQEQVLFSTELLAEELSEEQIEQAVSLVSLAADHWDAELKQAFGGETFFAGEATPAPDGGSALPEPPAGAAPEPDGKAAGGSSEEDPPAAGYI